MTILDTTSELHLECVVHGGLVLAPEGRSVILLNTLKKDKPERDLIHSLVEGIFVFRKLFSHLNYYIGLFCINFCTKYFQIQRNISNKCFFFNITKRLIEPIKPYTLSFSFPFCYAERSFT